MNKIPVITVPMAPIVPKGEKVPVKTKRLRPFNALDLRKMIDALETSIIKTINIDKHPWSVISVISPYSDDFHVMLMETSINRYLPSIEYIDDKEGNSLMKIWMDIIKYMKERKKDQKIYLGYNWSPRSWGKKEEETGFQSIPTKWHGMFWSWPDFQKEINQKENNKLINDEKNKKMDEKDLDCKNYEKLKYIDEKETKESFKRLNGKTKFGNDIVGVLEKK